MTQASDDDGAGVAGLEECDVSGAAGIEESE